MLIPQILKLSKVLSIGVFCHFLIVSMALASGDSSGNYSGFQKPDYDTGKKVFYEKVVCESCPYHDLSFVAEEVKSIFPDLKQSGSIGQLLTVHQRKSVKLFIKKRFDI